jgi:microcystin-dependent protein
MSNYIIPQPIDTIYAKKVSLGAVATSNNFYDLDNQPEIGTISAFIGSYHFSARDTLSGWLRCDGAEISRTTYDELFNIISTSFGGGDGTTTFNLPDFRGRAFGMIGQGAGLTNRNIGDTLGTETHTLIKDEMPKHDHGLEVGTTHIWMRSISSSSGRAFGTGAQTYNSIYTADGENEPHNNMQPTLFGGNVFIKY